jgi:hypothetical protein
MTAEEVYESVTTGGASDFAAAVQIFERFGPWCLIGGLAVNCYVEPVYTVDADFIGGSEEMEAVQRAKLHQVLGQSVPVAAPLDLIKGKVWAWEDQHRRLTKRKKDELDLLRLAEAYPELRSEIPTEIVRQLQIDED